MSVRLFRLLPLAVAILSTGTLSIWTACYAQVPAPITTAPPPLPVYTQPPCPADGDLWTPGYWAWDGSYYWVPGTWVTGPRASLLWTPGYWNWDKGVFTFREGYWSTEVGFYGGIDYGLGYSGLGFQGGRWDSGHFDYNTAVARVDSSVTHHLYNTPINDPVSHISYNGGPGGINMIQPPPDPNMPVFSTVTVHIPPVSAQIQHAWIARNDPKQRYFANRGAPPVTATSVPLIAIHPKDLPPVSHSDAGKFQKQQDQLVVRQSQDREKLQKKQDAEDQDVKQKGTPAKMQQVEQQHLHQTQDLMNRQVQETRELQDRQ